MKLRVLAFCIVIAGILSFFFTSVTTDPPVAGVVRWSPFNIVLQMYNGALPDPTCERCSEPLVRSLVALPLYVAIQYLLMVVALITLCFRRPSVVVVIAILGIYDGVRGGWGVATRLEFQETFFGLVHSGNVHYNELIVTHLVVMLALLLVSLEIRDQERNSRREGKFSTVPEQRQVLDADAGPECDKPDKPARDYHRLHQ